MAPVGSLLLPLKHLDESLCLDEARPPIVAQGCLGGAQRGRSRCDGNQDWKIRSEPP